MRVLFIPFYRFFRVTITSIFFLLAVIAFVIQFVLISLWTFKPIDAFYKVLSLFNSEFILDKWEVLNMNDNKYYYWSNAFNYIIDINNKQRKLNEERKYHTSRLRIGVPK